MRKTCSLGTVFAVCLQGSPIKSSAKLQSFFYIRKFFAFILIKKRTKAQI